MAGSAIKFENLRVALVHDWFTAMRGGERLIEIMCDIFPNADIYTLVWVKGKVSEKIENRKIYTSFIQKLPFAKNKYRHYLPLMPFAIESFKLKDYDLVFSSSHCAAKGIKILNGAKHICYCHTPMRYIWDQFNDYFSPERSNFFTRLAMKIVRPFLQKWDLKTASNVDYFITNSYNVQKRIKKIYNKESAVIYPNIDVDNNYKINNDKFFLMVTALVPYKCVDIAIKAFNELGYNLKIIGSGPDEKRLKKMAKPNIEFLGWVSDEEVKLNYANCRALVFPQEEDFGCAPIEAQAAGKPVIAYSKGGALETVIEGETGVFFNEPNYFSLIDAVKRFEKTKFNSTKIKERTKTFAPEYFKNNITNFIKDKMNIKC